MNALSISGLNKSFGSARVLDQLSFQVPEHSIFGFLGQNGAGKTTTMKLALGLLKPDSGTIQVFGSPVSYGQTKTNRMIGYLPDVPEFYGYMTPMEYLRLCGEVTGMSQAATRKKSLELLELTGLKPDKKKIGGYSRGMRQRLGIAQALLHEPRLLICDEPTSALDPLGRMEILEILNKLKGKTTVLFSTHILSDVEKICDHIAILHQGKIGRFGSMEEIKRQSGGHRLILELNGPEERNRLSGCAGVKPYLPQTEQSGCTMQFHSSQIDQVSRSVFQALVETDIIPVKFEITEPSLEHIFMEVVQ